MALCTAVVQIRNDDDGGDDDDDGGDDDHDVGDGDDDDGDKVNFLCSLRSHESQETHLDRWSMYLPGRQTAVLCKTRH